MLTIIDGVLIAAVWGIIYFGARIGFTRLLSFWLGTLAGSWLATRYGAVLAKKVSLTPIQSYLIISFLGFLVVVFAGYLISKIFHLILLAWLDHLLGMILGMLLAASLILIAAGLWPYSGSRLLNYCRGKIPALGLENRFLPELPVNPLKGYRENMRNVNREFEKISEEINKQIKFSGN